MPTKSEIAFIRNQLIAADNQQRHWEGQVALLAGALMEAGGTAAQVAALLGISRTTLWRRIKAAPGQERLTGV